MLTLKHFDDVNARRPMDLRYMKLLRNILRLLCSWPDQLFKVPARPFPLRDRRLLFVEALVVFIGGIVYIKKNDGEVTFLEMGQTYLTVFLSFVGGQRITVGLFQSYHKVMKEFLLDMHLFYHRNRTEYSEKIFQKVHRICAAFATFNVAELFLGVFLFNITPLFNNYMKGRFDGEAKDSRWFEHSIHYTLPFINQHVDLGAYIIIFIFNILLSFDASVEFSAFDITLSIIVFHIWGHLKILDNDLRSLPLPADMRDQPGRSDEDNMSYSKEENAKVAAMLKDIIDHHRKIMSLVESTSDAFGLTLCVYYLFHQVSGCILLLECAEMDAKSLTRYGPLSVTLIQLFVQISVIVELLGTQSETLKDAVYGAPWECMDAGNRRLLLFLLCHVQEPIRLKPLGMVSVGVQTMTIILKTSFSYFMLLKTFT